MAVNEIEVLRSKWSTLYRETLPKLARAKDPKQSKWPVTLDHCFARIILDNTVGRGVLQWDNVIDKPAVRHMDEQQLKDAISLGEKIQNGEVALTELDKKSLEARGKNEKKYNAGAKRVREHPANDGVSKPTVKKAKRKAEETQSTLSFATNTSTRQPPCESSPSTRTLGEESLSSNSKANTTSTPFPDANASEFLTKIQNHTGLTPFRKRLYSILLSVPSGHYTTYQAMANFLDSSARAVGNGIRNNPYAPDVPCHRVLASDGSIGGFYGSWGEQGKHAGEKIELLKNEGVYFDSRGRVKGVVFRDFQDLSNKTILLKSA